ncbi:unnamed protein product [Urochloa humidicola]
MMYRLDRRDEVMPPETEPRRLVLSPWPSREGATPLEKEMLQLKTTTLATGGRTSAIREAVPPGMEPRRRLLSPGSRGKELRRRSRNHAAACPSSFGLRMTVAEVGEQRYSGGAVGGGVERADKMYKASPRLALYRLGD